MGSRMGQPVGEPIPRRRGRAALVGLVALAMLTSAGCEYLLGYPFGPPPSFDPEAPFGSPVATYRSGTATVTMGDQVVTLDHLVNAGSLNSEFGAEVTWAGGDGWYLRVLGVLPQGTPGGFPYLTIDRVADGRHLTSYDLATCTFTIERADATGIAGKASCKSLTWVDAIGGSLASGPMPSEGPPFAAEVTFEATP